MNIQQTRAYYDASASARLGVLFIVGISTLLTPISLSAILVAVPGIARDLQVDAVYVSWIAASFLLSNLITLLPAGRLADIYGRKRLFLIGSFVYVLASIGAGLAGSIELILLFRVIQGMGSALFFGTGMAIVSSVYQGHGRGAALGWLSACVYVGLSAGPLIGGWVTDQFGWHAVFLFVVPFALLALGLTLFRMKGEWKSQEPEPMDWTGTLIYALWLLLVVGGASHLPEVAAWIAFLLSFAVLYLFVRHTRSASHPLIRLRVIWENRVFSRSLLAAVMMYAGGYGLLFLLGLYLQYNRGLSASAAGQMLVLQAIIMAVLAPLSGRLSDRWQPRLFATAGCLAFGLGLLLLQFLSEDTPLYLIGISLLLFGVGHGLFSTPNNSNALGAVSEERMGIASALVNMGRLMGQMLGTAVLTLLLGLFIGGQEIRPEHYAAMNQVVHYSALISLLFVMLAAWSSWQSGKVGQLVQQG
ncbi:MAG: MFS transporter [Thiothrix sp.]|nr:MFS transporter [Thiothrix sp.]